MVADETWAESAPSFSPLARRRFAAQVVVALPELGWSVCEPLFMPLLLQMHVPTEFLAVCWLVSPTLGLCLHPVIGKLSDKYGRRPFILVLGTLSAVGLVVTPFSTRLPGAMGLIVAMGAFGLTDVSHDLLLTPTRAAMNDVYEDAAECERRCATAGGISKMVALLCVTFLNGTVAFCSVAVLVALAMLLQVAIPDKVPRKNSDCMLVRRVSRPLSASDVPKGFLVLWALSFGGWQSICTFSFYLTSVWAERGDVGPPGSVGFQHAVQTASALLVGNAFAFTVVGSCLPTIVKFIGGEVRACASALVLMNCALLSFSSGIPVAFSVFFILCAVPIAYQIVANTPFAWLEKREDFDEQLRGCLTGWLNSSLAAGQALASVTSGPIVQLTGGRLIAAYWATAVVNFFILAVLFATGSLVSPPCHRDEKQTPLLST